MRGFLLVIRSGLLLAAYQLAPNRPVIERDLCRRIQPRLDLPVPQHATLREAAQWLTLPEVRSVFYERLRACGGPMALVGAVLSRIHRGQVAFQISCADIGPGFYLAHGFATIVVAERIGADCLVSQQVTIGWSDKGGPPVLGDRVRIGAGAIVIGPVTIDDDAVVGAGAVVIEDVPAGAVVGGVPARILPNAEDRFSGAGREGSAAT